jgi:hypothetical protein
MYLKAAISRLNWALLVPISRPSLDLMGPRVSRALQRSLGEYDAPVERKEDAQMSTDTQRACTEQSNHTHEENTVWCGHKGPDAFS